MQASLVDRANGELLRHAAVTKTGDLRKDKPDPMAGFSSRAELGQDRVVGGRLGGEEASEIVGVGHALNRDPLLIHKDHHTVRNGFLAPLYYPDRYSSTDATTTFIIFRERFGPT